MPVLKEWNGAAWVPVGVGSTIQPTDLASKAPISTTTIDLVDRTNNTTETVPAGMTTNCSTAGVTKTAPSLDNPVGTPPKRFAVKNLSTGNITVAYPDQAGAAQSLVVLPAETRTFRQKTTSGWGVESGAVAVDTLDKRYQALDVGNVAYWNNIAAKWSARRRAAYERDNATAFTVFVDSVNGVDTNTGVTPTQAYKTLAKVNTAGVASGARVGLARGSVFREAFTMPGTGGTAAAPTVFGAYGVGPKPIIKGSTVLSVSWAVTSGSTYAATTAVNPAVLWIDTDICLSKAASAGAVTVGTFFSDGTTMTAWLPDGTSPAAHVVEYVTGSTQGFTASTAFNYVTLQDIKICHFGSYQVFAFNATPPAGWNMRRCELGPGIKGAIFASIGGVTEDNYIHDIWTGVEYPSGDGYGIFFTTGSDSHEIRYNLVNNCYKGISCANAQRDVSVTRNLVIKCRVNGIDMNGGTLLHPPKVVNNFVWHNPTTPNGHGIDTQSGTVGPYWRNNIVYCDYTGTAGNVELYCIDSNSYASTDVDYNLGYLTPSSTASYGKLNTTLYSTLAAFQAALIANTSYAGKEAHSIQADPLLVDLTTGKYAPLLTSPAINAGAFVGGVDDDYLGTAPDLGAYEVT